MIDNKFKNKSFKENKAYFAKRLEMLENKAKNLEKNRVDLYKYLPENLQNFCHIAAINSNKIIFYIYPAIYLRQFKSMEKTIIKSIKTEHPEQFSQLVSLELKVRPLPKDEVISSVNSKQNTLGAQPKTIEKPDSIKQEFLELSKQVKDPSLKAQLEKMAK